MKFRRPRSLNELILIGFILVALPLLVAVIWALVNLDHLAEQSEKLVVSGVTAAENNRQLAQQVGSLERVARQFQVLRNEDSITLLKQDLRGLENTLRVCRRSLNRLRLSHWPERFVWRHDGSSLTFRNPTSRRRMQKPPLENSPYYANE